MSSPEVMPGPGASRAIVSCPTCQAAVPWHPGSRWRPFCSERCRLIDLGEWFNEEHRISESDDINPEN